MASLSPVRLGIIILLGFLPLLLSRRLLNNRFVIPAEPAFQPRRAFLLDFSICLLAALIINCYIVLTLDFPLSSAGSLLIGCIIAGFFIGVEASLGQERQVIIRVMETDIETPLQRHFFPMTRKLTVLAIATSVFVCIVLILIFSRDVEWLTKTAQDPESIASARLSVTYEIFFIMSILMMLIVNLIFSYSKNLNLLFTNETRILENVSRGDLSSKVPVATHDEFGVIAGHTNHMIDGLRHRFELINALKLAKEVQQNLLPSKSPCLKDYEVSGSSIYCEQTGGDYYDYFLLPDSKVGIVVADACGHGIGSAILMTSVRAFLHSAIADYTTPARLLHTINQHITRDCSVSGRFTTMFFMEIDPTGRRLQWVRAGHEPALIYHANADSFSSLTGKGLVLGIDASYEYSNEITDTLQADDIILIGTDGIGETRNPMDFAFGQDRIKEIIREYRDDTAEKIKKALVRNVLNFRDTQPQEDDITLVVIKLR